MRVPCRGTFHYLYGFYSREKCLLFQKNGFYLREKCLLFQKNGFYLRKIPFIPEKWFLFKRKMPFIYLPFSSIKIKEFPIIRKLIFI